MRKKKHIAVVCNYEIKPDRIGGMDRFFRAYNDHLVQLGHRVSWFFSGGKSIDFYSGFELYFPKAGSLETRVLDYLEAQEQVDVMVTHFLELCTPFYKSAKKNQVAYIIAVDHNPRPLKGFPFRKRIRNRLKGLMFSRYIDKFVGVSKYTRNQILKDYGSFLKSKTTVIYNGINTGLYIKKNRDNKGKFIIASHLRESKGIQDLIDAAYLLPENLKTKMTVDIYGEGPLESFLRKKVTSMGLEQQFNFMGSSANLPSLFHQYFFLLQPTYMECFSLSILESLSANVPVVTTPVGGNPEIIRPGENGFFFEPGDVASLMKLLEGVLQGNLVITMNVSDEIERDYHLEKMVAKHIKVLQINEVGNSEC